MTTTATATTALTAAGNEYEELTYVDPYPGKAATDTVRLVCYKCGGNKVVNWGNVTLATSQGEARWCFACMGSGYETRKVATLRRNERAYVKAENIRRAEAADWEAGREEREAAEAAREAEEARQAEEAEAARIAAMVQGFVAEVGTRIRKLPVEVVTNFIFETESYRGYGIDYKSILILKAEDGKIIKWTTDAKHFEKGDKLILTATVKDHANYKGQDQTVVQRGIYTTED